MSVKLGSLPRLSVAQGIGLSYMIARWILGISFINAAVWKIFILTPVGHATKFFLIPFKETWIPNYLLWPLGLTIPFFELFVGILFCIGWRAREVAFATGLLLILTTYGHSLLEPLYNISQGLTMARVALVLFLLVTPDDKDYISVSFLLKKVRKP